MKDFQGYRQKKNNEFAQQKAQRLELRNGNKISHSRDNDEYRMAVQIGCQAGSWSLHLGIAAWHYSVGCKRCMSGGTVTRGRLRGWGCVVPWTSPKSYATRAAVSPPVSQFDSCSVSQKGSCQLVKQLVGRSVGQSVRQLDRQTVSENR